MRSNLGGKYFLNSISVLLSVLALSLFLGSCTQKMVCPAYQSAFIFDTTALKQQFSYFKNDTPKIVEVNKNKFLLIEPIPYKRQLASFRTIEMLPIYPVIPDSLRFQGDSKMSAEMDVQDSTATDSVQLHPGLIGPKFNVEQQNYMYYFRKTLVLPDVRAQLANQEPVKVGFFKKIGNFFTRPFKKRKARKERERQAEGEVTEDVEETNSGKKGIFNRFKKKDKAEAEAAPEAESNEGNTEEASTEEEGTGNEEGGGNEIPPSSN